MGNIKTLLSYYISYAIETQVVIFNNVNECKWTKRGFTWDDIRLYLGRNGVCKL